MEQSEVTPARSFYASLLADAEELAVHLEEEMTAAQHEHARPELVRELADTIRKLEEAGIEQAAKYLEADQARVQWRELALKRARQLESLTRKHLKRGIELGVLRQELRRVQEQHERRIEELKGRSRTIRDLKRALTVSNANREALRSVVVQLRQRLRDSNLRKLTLAFNAGGMELEVGSKVVEPVNAATDAELLEVIQGALRSLGESTAASAAPHVLAALRNVR